MRRSSLSCLALVGALAFVSACGDDDSTDPAAEAPASVDSVDSSAAPDAAAFPVTIEHKYGSIILDSEPLRVVSIGFSDQDWLLALGVTPIAIRDWYGEQPFATWPWAQDELGDAEPVVLDSGDLNFEQIAELQPDLIVGVSSGMTDTDYDTLAQIAPTLAQPKDFIDYGTPWDVATEMIGRAVGRTQEAADVIEHVNGLYAAARDEHPEFAGATASVSFYFDGMPGAYASQDPRSRLISDLGFTIPSEFDELAGDAFFFSVSNEDISTLDTDVLIWIVASDADIASVAGIVTRPSLTASTEGREVLTDAELSGAFSFASPLSIEYLLDELVPELALAVDGDPATAVPSAAALGGEGAAPADAPAVLDAEQQAAANAFATVFDSTVPFAEKAELLAEPELLETASNAYEEAGSAMQGINLKPTAVAITGDEATITYDVLFSGQVRYPDLTKVITRVDGAWVVPTEVFCDFLTSARVSCP